MVGARRRSRGQMSAPAGAGGPGAAAAAGRSDWPAAACSPRPRSGSLVLAAVYAADAGPPLPGHGVHRGGALRRGGLGDRGRSSPRPARTCAPCSPPRTAGAGCCSPTCCCRCVVGRWQPRSSASSRPRGVRPAPGDALPASLSAAGAAPGCAGRPGVGAGAAAARAPAPPAACRRPSSSLVGAARAVGWRCSPPIGPVLAAGERRYGPWRGAGGVGVRRSGLLAGVLVGATAALRRRRA